MEKEDKAQLEKICERYRVSSFRDWPSPMQVSFDIGWLIGMVVKLDSGRDGRAADGA